MYLSSTVISNFCSSVQRKIFDNWPALSMRWTGHRPRSPRLRNALQNLSHRNAKIAVVQGDEHCVVEWNFLILASTRLFSHWVNALTALRCTCTQTCRGILSSGLQNCGVCGISFRLRTLTVSQMRRVMSLLGQRPFP